MIGDFSIVKCSNIKVLFKNFQVFCMFLYYNLFLLLNISFRNFIRLVYKPIPLLTYIHAVWSKKIATKVSAYIRKYTVIQTHVSIKVSKTKIIRTHRNIKNFV